MSGIFGKSALGSEVEPFDQTVEQPPSPPVGRPPEPPPAPGPCVPVDPKCQPGKGVECEMKCPQPGNVVVPQQSTGRTSANRSVYLYAAGGAAAAILAIVILKKVVK